MEKRTKTVSMGNVFVSIFVIVYNINAVVIATNQPTGQPVGCKYI